MTNRLNAKDTVPTDAQNMTNPKPNRVKSVVLSHDQITKKIKGDVGKGPKTEVIISPFYKSAALYQFNEEGKTRMFKTLRERLTEDTKETEISEKDRTKLELAAHKFDIDYEDLEELYVNGGIPLVVKFLEEEDQIIEEDLSNTLLYENNVVSFTKSPKYDPSKIPVSNDTGSGGAGGGKIEYYKVRIEHNPKMREGIVHRVEAETPEEAQEIAFDRHINAVVGGRANTSNALKPKHWKIVSLEIDHQRKEREKNKYSRVIEVRKKKHGMFDSPGLDYKKVVSNEKLITSVKARKSKPTAGGRVANYIKRTITDINTPVSQYAHHNQTGSTGESGEAKLNKRKRK